MLTVYGAQISGLGIVAFDAAQFDRFPGNSALWTDGQDSEFQPRLVMDQLTFRVALDTDVELALKLFNQIDEELVADLELAPDLLEPFKSKGIADLEDGTLVFRAKFTPKPGKQSAIRWAALKAVHNENGIRAVTKPTSDHRAMAIA
ncbi:hypothetical protein [Mesorhizobium muleiense]|jgi:small-conductance mechanosensitive channel|uniref:hypothetical protein n=1 Tax=Mesorhizobium muleiense TaxID=1004279 RepID=UPI001F361FAB|nr:hypothetical protein [Mesorhizobium muleiense]MCF6110865.1 hypothetical protein [Mesorhizobium muleiense]